jgi:hypothetical protein
MDIVDLSRMVLGIAICSLVYGIVFFLIRFFRSDSKEKKRILTTPTSVLTIITIFIMIIGPLLTETIFFTYNHYFFIILIAINTLMVSRALTLSTMAVKIKLLSKLFPIFFGIGSWGIFFLFFIGMYRGELEGHSLVVPTAALFGSIVCVLSIILNIFEKKRLERKKQLMEEK